MNSITPQIHDDFVQALRNKDEDAKRTLSFLKSKINDLEKSRIGQPISNEDIYDIVSKLMKQRKESIDLYTKANRMDLVNKEYKEYQILSVYQPKQLSFNEISNIVKVYYNALKDETLNKQALSGKIIGLFNKSYRNQADINILKKIVNDIVG